MPLFCQTWCMASNGQRGEQGSHRASRIARFDAGRGNQPHPSAYPAPRTVRTGFVPPFAISAFLSRPTWTSIVRLST